MALNSKQLVAEAANATDKLSPDEAARLVGDADTVFVDVRDQSEREKSGTIQGAVHVPRGLLEFRADPDSPAFEKAFAGGKRLVLFCASGGRAALAAKTLKDAGIARIAHVSGGGFEALKAANAPIMP